ncbi:hypothetical protein FA95DRAFT_1613587 [Auriscalpium vulgare]|uniref:Uncharacterized protein n=1 Tax=Auriscalpium vulgare TaxID=40419 RepID=A0ACB8R240_9AGAM|nr:hypothetical protein FA95DRAFT_1613587 [Auriscalpium vulgare]
MELLSFSKTRTPRISSTAPALPLDICTPGPFPIIYDSHAAAPLDDVVDDQVREWLRTPGSKLLLRIFGQSARDPKNHAAIAAKIVMIFSKGFGEQEPLVAAPLPIDETDPDARTATTFLLHGISERTMTAALEMRILDSKDLSMQAMPLELRNSPLVLLIKGFTTTRTEIIREVVDKKWRDEESSVGLTRIVVESATENIPLTVEHVTDFIDSVSIIRIDMKGTGALLVPHFAVLTDPDTLPAPHFWFYLREHFQSLAYRSNMVGTGTILPYLNCPLCHGCDHPRGLCPFPLVPGWQGEGIKPPSNPKSSKGRARPSGHGGKYEGPRKGKRD